MTQTAQAPPQPSGPIGSTWAWSAFLTSSMGFARAHATWLVAIGFTIVTLLHARAFFHDDVYITFRYVERLLDGKGLTWTSGPPVEGFTHPLWLAQLVVAAAFGIHLEAASKMLGLAYLAGILWVWRRSGAWALPLWVFVALPGTALWTLGGLEMMGYLFWLFVGAICTLRLVRSAPATGPVAAGPQTESRLLSLAVGGGLALAAATLHRPDGLIFACIAPVAVWFGPHRRLAVPVAAAGGLPILAYMGFRLSYFGATQAAPASAKITGIPLRLQLESFAAYFTTSAGLWLPGAAAVAVVLLWRPTRLSVAMFVVALGALGPAVLGGGDHMLGARLFLPVTGLLCLACGLRWAESRPPFLLELLVAAGALVHAAHVFTAPVGRDPAAVWGRIMGELLAEHLPAGTLVAAATAGSTPYFSPDLDYIDTLGLNDRHIADRPINMKLNEWQSMPGHRKGDGNYVLSRKPDVIIRGGAAGDSTIVFLTDYELEASEAFRREYQPYYFSAPAPYLRQLAPDQAPAEAVRLGRARMTAWLRVTSEKVQGLRDIALNLPSAPKPGAPPPVAGKPPPPVKGPVAVAPATGPGKAKAPSAFGAVAEKPGPGGKRPGGVFRPAPGGKALAGTAERHASGLDAVVRCVGGQPEVEFSWNPAVGHELQYLDLASMGSADALGYDVSGVRSYRMRLTAGVYDWRINSKFVTWRASTWSLLTVGDCPTP